ncbi:hypothetical protein S820908_076 [Synechococcus phage S-CAM9]|uniref:Uncharacterized protein n=1 Tax=Synechococcus phage S-CAM9 TaxID=1883369 RepID=A0A1D8KNI8_9CAUD|nr:hypothetical protein BOW85_gp172 [Synechococcus phage S-CAM9]AOV60224.1 hypothetical protein S050808_077 [Synechococcus phage S-CAM9]AOV60451.1 hypothetical protein S820908_076 [Synechococcus phage S-CAM9]AOV60680.1 hypothetical protein N161109_077 [Synechococcus phage S-CAM9]
MSGVRVAGVNGIKVVTTSRAQAGGSLASLTDTNVSNLANGYILVYDSVTALWTSQSTLPDNIDLDGGAF